MPLIDFMSLVWVRKTESLPIRLNSAPSATAEAIAPHECAERVMNKVSRRLSVSRKIQFRLCHSMWSLWSFAAWGCQRGPFECERRKLMPGVWIAICILICFILFDALMRTRHSIILYKNIFIARTRWTKEALRVIPARSFQFI